MLTYFRAISNKNVIATLVFMAFIKLFKYIAFNKTMTQLSTTLTKVNIESLYARVTTDEPSNL